MEQTQTGRRVQILWMGIIAWSVVGITSLVIAIQAWHRQVKDLALAHPLDINDFNRWLTMLPQFLHQHAAITGNLWPMPPFTFILLAPFSWLPFPAAQFAWVLCKPIMVAIIFYSVLAMVRCCGRKIDPLPMVLILLAWIWPIIGDMQEGQMNLLMLTPLAVGLFLLQREQTWSDLVGGLLLGMAVAIKVTPIIFLIYLLWRRRWIPVLAMLGGIVFWLLVPLTLFFGVHQAVRWNQQYIHAMISPYLLKDAVTVHAGESMPSFLIRLLTHSAAFITHHHGVAKKYYVNILSLSVPLAERIIRMILLAIGIVGLLWMRRRLPTFKSCRYIFEIGAVAAFLLWTEEWAWVPHYVTLIFTLMAAGLIASDPAARPAVRLRMRILLAISAALMAMTSDLIKIFGPHADNYGRTFDPVLFAGIILVLGIMTAAYSWSVATAEAGTLSDVMDQTSP
ncbi:MAG: glycosyltransferase family 87 protein [Phycisphaerae bacterium]